MHGFTMWKENTNEKKKTLFDCINKRPDFLARRSCVIRGKVICLWSNVVDVMLNPASVYDLHW